MKINHQQWREIVRLKSAKCDILMKDGHIACLSEFAVELVTWNQKINLTAITDPEEVAEKHIIDSLIPAKYIPENSSLLDLGTGGGFPGVPLKIFMPTLSVMLVDSVRKKVNFLKYVIGMLKLENITAHQLRVEVLSDHPDFTGRFDVVISRAFTALDRFLQMAAPLVKSDGVIIAMKGREVDKEIMALKNCQIEPDVYKINNCRLKLQVEKYRLPISGDERSLVLARQI